MLNRLPQDKPVPIKGTEWDKRLARCRRELEIATRGDKTGVGAGYDVSEGNRLARVPEPVLSGPEARA